MFVPQSGRIMNAPRLLERRLNALGALRPPKRIQPDVLDKDGQVKSRPAGQASALQPTPTDDDLPRRYADFATMTEALDYAAQGQKGINFHDARATLLRVYPFAELREDPLAAARRAAEGWATVSAAEPGEVSLPEPKADDIAYLQYSSGSTRFPHGVVITHKALMSNLAAHAHSMHIGPGDRGVSWLPFYHDMGLVGCMLSIVANQMSAGYLKTEDFARRPPAWLDLISRHKGTAMSYSPTFGYDICARRVSSQTDVANRFDLSRWRVAGNGADMIRPDVMQSFVDTFAPAGFKATSFLPSYGLAEATLAVTVMPPGEGILVELVEETLLPGGGPGERDRPQRYRAVVNCGRPVREMELEIRGDEGGTLSEREIGRVFCRGASVMAGYFRDEEATQACLDEEGWLDTGDMGYLSDGYLYVVGRAKDMIIINGKNHWPQDIEWAVEQLPGFKAGDIAAFSITTPGGEEAPAVLVQCRTSDDAERGRLRDAIRERVRAITGINCVIELVPPRSLPRTSSGKLSRAKARNLYLSGEIATYDVAA